jgi:erythromycin esterase
MKLKFLLFFAGCFLTSHYCFAQSADAAKYIKDNAIVIDTNSNSEDLKDLSYLKTTLEGKRVIGMGEATHGTEQFQTTKFRVLKYLVTQMNYKLFGIEANFTECRRVNDFVLYGKGDPKKAVSGMYFWTWNTTEVLKMVQWMRDYNAEKPDAEKVKFYGFDMQFDMEASRLVDEKLKKLDSNYFKTNFSRLSELRIMGKGAYTVFRKTERDSVQKLLVDIADYVNTQNDNLLKIYSAEEIVYMKRDIRLLQQCLDLGRASVNNHKLSHAAYNARDKYMAENAEWILDYEGPESKMMIWAHNYHISKTNISAKRMGYYLKKNYQDQYYCIGFDFNKGSFRAVDTKTNKLKTFTVPEANVGSSGNFFSTLNMPEFFVDMEKAVKANSPAKSLFTKRITQRSTGAVFNMDKEKDTYLLDPLYEYYDGLIFVNETTATMPIK